MKNHIITIILLLFAVVAFVLQFFVEECLQIICDIATFVLPTIAAIIEMILCEKSNKKLKKEIDKRAVWECLTQEEIENLKEGGKLDENTFYAPIE